MPQTVSASGSLSSPGAVWHSLKIQGLALSHGRVLPCREPFLIGNMPTRLFACFAARVAPQRGLHVTLLVSRVHAVRNIGMGSRTPCCATTAAPLVGVGLWSSCVRLLLQNLLW